MLAQAFAITVRNVLGYPHYRLALIATPSNHIIYRVLRLSSALGGNPGMNGKPTSPTPCIGVIDQ